MAEGTQRHLASVAGGVERPPIMTLFGTRCMAWISLDARQRSTLARRHANHTRMDAAGDHDAKTRARAEQIAGQIENVLSTLNRDGMAWPCAAASFNRSSHE